MRCFDHLLEIKRLCHEMLWPPFRHKDCIAFLHRFLCLGLAGVLASANRILTKVLVGGERESTAIFFLISLIILTMCLLIFWPPGRRVIPQQLTVQWCYLESNAAFLNVKQEHKVRPKTDTANSAILGRLQKIWKQLPYLYWDLMTVESSTYLTVMLCIVGRKRIKWS